MAKTKYDFIKELLENKKIKQIHRERILELAAKEFLSDRNLEERIQEIEKVVFKDIPTSKRKQLFDIDQFGADNEDEQEKEKREKPTLPKYVYPSSLYKFLFQYNQNKILKSTCHDIDSDEILTINEYCATEQYDFQKHLKEIINAYEIHEKKYFAPPALKALIRGYLMGKDYSGNELTEGWSTDKINIYWSHPKLISWAKKNPGIPPNPSEGLIEQNENVGYEFERFVSKVSDRPVQNFRELVIHFKHLFHLRNDNSLREIIESKNRIENWNNTIDFETNDTDFPKNIEHFTDVDKLVQAYKKTIQLINEQHTDGSKPKVKLTFFENEDSVNLSIHHLNSTYNKTIQNTIDRGIGKTYYDLIKFQINGMCNLYLKADFGLGNYAQINLWDGKELKAQKIKEFKGVEHILEFPRK
jgi:hypothetical protein